MKIYTNYSTDELRNELDSGSDDCRAIARELAYRLHMADKRVRELYQTLATKACPLCGSPF